MTMQSEENEGKAGNNYTVVRVRRDVFRSSDVGAIVLSRQPSGDSSDFNRVAGLDANFRFFKSLSINGFAARSDSPGVTTNQNSGKASIGWEDSSKRLQASIMTIGEGFKDDLGFVRRSGVTRQFYDWASFLQPESLRTHGIRQLQPHARMWHLRRSERRPRLQDDSHRQPDHLEQRIVLRIRVRAARRGDFAAVRDLTRA